MNIDIVVNTDEALEYARRKLGGLEKRAPQAVRTALNNAAKEIKKADEKTAKSTYTDTRDLNKLTMDKASARNLEVILRDSGEAVSMTHFKPYIGRSGVMVTINKNNGPKLLHHKSGKTAFFPGLIKSRKRGRYVKKNVTKGYLRNGGATIMGRLGNSRLPIEKINSLSSPSAHGSPGVWNKVEPDGEALLYKHLDKELERILSL